MTLWLTATEHETSVIEDSHKRPSMIASCRVTGGLVTLLTRETSIAESRALLSGDLTG